MGKYDMFICIECIDHKRPADVTWVESMAKKHENLSTSKLVLWSKNGFSKNAAKKAIFLNIDVISQKNIEKIDWVVYAKKLLDAKLRLLTVEFSPFIDVFRENSELFRMIDVQNKLIYNEKEEIVQSIPIIVDFISKNKKIGSILLDKASIGKNDFYAEIVPPQLWFVIAPDNKKYRIKRIGFGMKSFVEEQELKTASAKDNEEVVTFGTATTESGSFEILIEEKPDGTNKIQTRIRKE
jgi:hypothetical protein